VAYNKGVDFRRIWQEADKPEKYREGKIKMGHIEKKAAARGAAVRMLEMGH
jgi:hypothetical protein